jgi:hypothetical protein
MTPRVALEPAIRWISIVALIFVNILCGGLSPALALDAATEPTYERAVALWPDIRRPIMFAGCKDHTDEFAVMWNGNISAQTPTATDADRRLFHGRKDDSLQLTFSAGEHPHFENREQEDGSTSPSLRNGYLPVALIQRREEGVEMLQEAFATDERGMCTAEQWDSPVFLRLRFTIRRKGEGSGPVHLWVQIAPNHTSYNTAARRNIRILPVAPDYPRQLHQAGNLLLDSRGVVVLAANRDFRFHTRLEPPLASVALGEFHLDRNVVEFALPRAEGATVEMIVPFVPAPPDRMERAARLSHDQALAAVIGCWEREIGRGVQISVPEERLNQLWRYTAPITYIAADGYPGGEKILKPAPHQYEACWPTLVAIQVAALARMGYFAEAAAYLHPFLDAKRRKPVPNSGSSYLSAAGFLSGPGEHIAVSWVSDHGATLWAASDYYLLTRDASFLREWLPVLLEGLEWIAKEREQMTRAGGDGAGLMPAGRATDAEMQSQFVWNDAWSFRGLDAVCRVLKAIDHPSLARWERERNDYRDVFRKAFAAQIRRTVRWTDAKGADIPFIPWELGQTGAGALHAFYLDTGPMVLGSVGLVDPTDESMTWAMRWLTDGPDSRKGSPDWSDWKERPSLRYEISSAEPSCSWNIFLRFLRNERLQFLEGFYSLAAGAVSRKFNGGMETRDGINGVALTNAVLSTHLRNMLLFEDPEQAGIEFLRNAPAAWLKAGAEIRVQKAPTYFGETSFLVRSDGSRVEADIELPSRNPAKRVTLHLVHPEGLHLKSVRVNDTFVPVSTPDSVTIEKPPGRVKITAEFQSASTVQ